MVWSVPPTLIVVFSNTLMEESTSSARGDTGRTPVSGCRACPHAAGRRRGGGWAHAEGAMWVTAHVRGPSQLAVRELRCSASRGGGILVEGVFALRIGGR
eukprot:COSAG01_NODE_5406_length_4282_cov_2.946211_2_plen_100_part_00